MNLGVMISNWFWEKLGQKPPRYNGVPRNALVYREVQVRSISGFRVPLRLSIQRKVTDREKLWVWRMLDGGRMDALVDQWIEQIFRPQLKQQNCAFQYRLTHTLEWSSVESIIMRPWVACVAPKRIEDRDSHTPRIDDTHFWGGIVAAQGACNEIEFEDANTRGCQLHIMSAQIDSIEPSLIQENIEMMSQQDREESLQHEQAAVIEERATLAAIQRVWDVEKSFGIIDQQYETDFYSIGISGQGGKMELSWTIKKQTASDQHDVDPDRVRLIGRRGTHGFPGMPEENEDSTPPSGTRVIDSRHSGNDKDVLEPGRTYFFRFYLDGLPARYHKDDLTFKIAVPEEQDPVERLQRNIDVEKLQQQLDHLQNRRTDSSDSEDALAKKNREFQEDAEHLELQMGWSDQLDTMQREAEDKARAKGLSREEETRKLRQVQAMFNRMRQKFLY